jgi:predicted alpha/beta hydrolase
VQRPQRLLRNSSEDEEIWSITWCIRTASRDMKASALVELMSPFAMTFYARMCGWTLARAHARSGDPIAIAEYLGPDGTVDKAIADFSARYADQNQRDYDAFVKAIADGRIQAIAGV